MNHNTTINYCQLKHLKNSFLAEQVFNLIFVPKNTLYHKIFILDFKTGTKS